MGFLEGAAAAAADMAASRQDDWWAQTSRGGIGSAVAGTNGGQVIANAFATGVVSGLDPYLWFEWDDASGASIDPSEPEWLSMSPAWRTISVQAGLTTDSGTFEGVIWRTVAQAETVDGDWPLLIATDPRVPLTNYWEPRPLVANVPQITRVRAGMELLDGAFTNPPSGVNYLVYLIGR